MMSTSEPTLFPLHVQHVPGPIERYGETCRADRRPDNAGEAILEYACSKILDAVMDWAEEPRDSKERPGFLKDLMKASRHNDDGFEIVQALQKKCSWEVNRDLIDILDNLEIHRDVAHRRAVAAWVKAHNITPVFEVGAEVVLKTWDKERRYRDVVGEIIRIDREHATYSVCCAELGHKGGNGHRSALVVPFEKVAPFNVT